MTQHKIGIIGFGDFAKIMIKYLSPYAEIVVATRQNNPDSGGFACNFVSDQEALSQPIVIPSMPSQFLEDYFIKNAHYLKPGSLVIDVCSVKVKPVEVLSRVLPQNVNLLATHPMFGPASAAHSITGQRIMLYPIRLPDDQYESIKNFANDILELHVIETTPEKHDKAMAYVQGLSHYIGRTMDIMEIPQTKLLTDAYEDLLDMKRIQGGDSWELFESIMFENPYAFEVHEQFKQACKELDKQLGLNH